MNYSELIDNYLDGSLSDDEREEFERELRQNPGLAEKVMQIKELHETISKFHKKKKSLKRKFSSRALLENLDEKQINELIEKFKSGNYKSDDAEEFAFGSILRDTIKEGSKKNNKRRCGIFKKWWMIAGIVVLIAAGSAILICTRLQTSYDTLYSEYYQTYHFSATRGQKEKQLSIDNAFSEYEEGRYESAITMLSNLEEIEKNQFINLWIGLSYMELENYNSAINEFTKGLDQSDYIGRDYYTWYLALCYVKIQDKKKSLEMLNQLKLNGDNYFSEKAKTLFKKLNRIR